MSNVNILLHIDDNKKFMSFIDSDLPLDQLIQKGVGGVDAIYVSDELTQVLDITGDGFKKISRSLALIEKEYDYLIIDTGAGLSQPNIEFMLSSDRVILLTNPELTALVDLYRVIKIVSLKKPGISFEIVVNKVPRAADAAEIFQSISQTVGRFSLQTTLTFLGYILDDPKRVLESIQKRIPLLILNSSGGISQCFQLLTTSFLKKSKQRQRTRFFFNLLQRR